MYSGTCLMRHTKAPGKCVGLYRLSEYSGFFFQLTEILWDHKFLSDVTGFGKLRCQIAHVFQFCHYSYTVELWCLKFERTVKMCSDFWKSHNFRERKIKFQFRCRTVSLCYDKQLMVLERKNKICYFRNVSQAATSENPFGIFKLFQETIFIPPTTTLQGGILVSPCLSVHPSVRPSVDKSYVVR